VLKSCPKSLYFIALSAAWQPCLTTGRTETTSDISAITNVIDQCRQRLVIHTCLTIQPIAICASPVSTPIYRSGPDIATASRIGTLNAQVP
tara:strand:+ start:645 stop:917 length:273 start_codon:yes stop_codon:yes gene_type:complete